MQPWELNPYEPISWWKMLHFSARGFYWTGQYLEYIKVLCIVNSMPEDRDVPVFALMTPLEDDTRKKAFGMLELVEGQCRSIGLNITSDTVADLRKALESNILTSNCQWLFDQVQAVQKLVEKEMKGKLFFYSPPDRAKFFPQINDLYTFGQPVLDAFPSATYDIFESAMCLALARSTASVFHLMRTLEIALTVLGKQFDVSLEHTNWGPALGSIEKKIRGMHENPEWKALPNCKHLQEQYAQVASTFGVFKDAWRNYTMHVRGKYTESEAELIFSNLKAFMQKLTEMGLKEI